MGPGRFDAAIRVCQLYYKSGKYKMASEFISRFFTYDLEEIKEQCEFGICDISDHINCGETLIKSRRKINNIDDLDTCISTLLKVSLKIN